MAKKRRTRSPHPGVVLIRPDATHTAWRARYEDPDTGQVVKDRLDPFALRTAEARADWAVRKAKAIAKRRVELEGGAARTTGTGVAAGVKRYFDDHETRLAAKTRVEYQAAADKLVAFCKRVGVASCDDLTGPRLVAFKASLAKAPKSVAAPAAKRGKRKPAAEPRSPHTVNKELRAVTTVLTYLRRLGLLPRLTSDDVKDGLQRLKAPPKRIDWRKPHELRALLEAAMRHDADNYTATREEHAGKREPGTTPRYTAIAPAIVAALVTGLRVSHLLGLQWSDVDLQALDEHGNPVGEIVPAGGSMTKRTGVIGLEVSPALRKLLAAMKLASGGKGAVFKLSEGEATAALKRLRVEYGAPAGCTWQAFRRTCECFLVNAHGVFGGASAYRAAKQLGHSVQIAERFYVDLVRGIPREARTVEAAMQIEGEVARVVDAAGARPAAAPALAIARA